MDNKELFKQALDEAMSNKFDEIAAQCTENVKLNADSVNYLAFRLNKLVDDAAALYLSDEEIPEELADALGTMWEMCSDFISMYESGSREGTKNASGELYWFEDSKTP